MGKAWVFQSRGPVFDSRRITVVSGRAYDLKCSCATLVQVRRPVLILEIKKRVTSRFLTKYHRVSRLLMNVSFSFANKGSDVNNMKNNNNMTN